MVSKKFKIVRDYWDSGQALYQKENIEINPGLTVLVGCNGSGKTTLIHQLKELLNTEEVIYTSFNNLIDGGENAKSLAGFYGNISFVTNSIMSSEGENILMNIGNFATKIGKAVTNVLTKDQRELWVFFDATDSGLSIDGIKEIKNKLFPIIEEDCKKNKIVLYIVVSTNAYEFANGEQCFDVYNCKYRTFKNYDEYSEFICKSREIKDKRYRNKKGE